jgi:uncharacterized damage-inducible protein DinB
MDQKLVSQYEAGGQKLQKSVTDLSKQDLLWTPPPESTAGLWSIQQIILHLMDSDIIWAARMKLIIADEHPTLLGFDENKFAQNLFYDQQDPQAALKLFDLNRQQFSRVLRKLPESAASRTGQHNERGSITLGQSVKLMIEHVDHHIDFVLRKRKELGKPLKD